MAPALGFDEALLTGLARDGGLYVPEFWPALSGPEIRSLAGLLYVEAVFQIMHLFVGALIEHATGKPLDPKIFEAGLRARHLGEG